MIDGEAKTLEFGHEGVLYKNSFIMYDKLTNTKWNHSTGLAMKGPLAGRELRMLPTRMMRWKDWLQLHPQTKVFLGRAGGFSNYRGGPQAENLGLSVGRGPNATFYPVRILREKIVVNDVVNGQPVAIVFHEKTGQMFAYSRVVNGRTLRFDVRTTDSEDSHQLVDRQTGSVWNLISGKAVRGTLRGKQLQNVVAVTWSDYRWRQIYESGSVYGDQTE